MVKLRSGSTILMVVLHCLALVATASSVAAASSDHAVDPVILVATVTDQDPGAPPDRGRFLVQVEEVIQGAVPGSVLVVSSDGTGVAGRALPAPARLVPGRRLHMVLRQEPDGSYLVLDARLPDREEEADAYALPGVLAQVPLGPEPDGPSPRLASKATATAPYEHQVVELTNEERWNNGNLPPYKKAAELESSAGLHSNNMADRDFFAHCDPDTLTSPANRMVAAGYIPSYASENIAAGYTTPSAVVAGWMASSGHRTAILSTSSRELGVGYRYQSGDQANVRRDTNRDCTPDSFNDPAYFRYWTQNFGRRNLVYPVVIERELWETTTPNVALYVYGEGWADDMRFSNDGATWSSWETYSPNKMWTLSSGGGDKTVWAQIRRSTTVLEATDTIQYVTSCSTYPDVVDPGVQTVNGAQSWTACDMVTSGDGFRVGAAGSVIFQAKNRVVLRSGFSIASGGSFVAQVDPGLE